MMSRDESIRVVSRLCAGGDGQDEDAAVLDGLKVELPNSDISDLIVSNDVIFGEFRHYTPQQIVDGALRR